jgi:hypothetical protein
METAFSAVWVAEHLPLGTPPASTLTRRPESEFNLQQIKGLLCHHLSTNGSSQAEYAISVSGFRVRGASSRLISSSLSRDSGSAW